MTDIEMEDILPHKKPMILIDRVVAYDLEKRSLTAQTTIKPENMFFDAGIDGVPMWVGLEYMAQSIAALSGLYERDTRGAKPAMGFILGTRKYTNALSFFKAGETYRIHVAEEFTDSELGNFRCKIQDRDGKVCAEAELNVFCPKDQSAFLHQDKEKKNG